MLLASVKISAQPSYLSHQNFRGTRVVNGHSVETLIGGEMEMIIGHRFGRINDGFYELFGLDQANIRLGLDYGITDNLMIGAGRSSQGKEFDAFAKMRFIKQGDRWPMSISAFSAISYNSLKNTDPDRPIATQNRLAFVHQVFIARRFTDRLTLQIMPSLAHYNLVETIAEGNDKLTVGAAGKFQLSKNLALTAEYYFMPDKYLPAGKQNPLSFGLDINTGSHVFQLHFTNASGMIEKQFLGETTGDWRNGDIHFGFNMVRTFKLKGRRY
jgi:hypothetical protein